MSRPTTPSQTVGPFFSIGFSWLERTDLTEGAAGCARVTIRGRVLDGEDQPVPDAVLEIWQADAEGRYAHPEDFGDVAATKGFFGFGRVSVNDQGEFRFTTIKPGQVPGPNGNPQAPHLEISIFMRGLLRRLVTRIYFPADPANEADAVLKLVPTQRRHTLIAQPIASEAQTLLWDVHLQGDHETVFFEE
jgi:protocatechuate 3,4-dioxygenase, alpha subunit